jgi:hypothetical protein
VPNEHLVSIAFIKLLRVHKITAHNLETLVQIGSDEVFVDAWGEFGHARTVLAATDSEEAERGSARRIVRLA